jgi:hypothetical protein
MAFAAGEVIARTAVMAAEANKVRAVRMGNFSFRRVCEGRHFIGSWHRSSDVITVSRIATRHHRRTPQSSYSLGPSGCPGPAIHPLGGARRLSGVITLG